MGHDIVLGFKKLHPDAVLPSYAHEGDACMDLFPLTVSAVDYRNQTAVVSTGLSANIPAGYALMIYSRSGQGFKEGTRLANCVGVIDSGYKGEIMVKLKNDSCVQPVVEQGKAIAQAMLVRVPHAYIMEVMDVGESERGEGGFGSSDKTA